MFPVGDPCRWPTSDLTKSLTAYKVCMKLLREAARIYIERKERWNNIFAKTSIQSGEQAFTEKDVLEEISRYRSEKRK
jgi:hypothetical protein